MGAVVLIPIGIFLAGGGFTIIATGTASTGRLIAASILFVLGAILILWGVVKAVSEGKGEKPQPPAPKDVLKGLLQKEYAELQKIENFSSVENQETALPVWQKRVGGLMKDAIADAACWQGFDNLGPGPGRKIPTQIWEQERYLEEVIQNFDGYTLRAVWTPPATKRKRFFGLFGHGGEDT